MPSYQQVKGLPVVTMAEGKKIGRVVRLLVEPDTRQVRWMRVHQGRFGGNYVWVPTDAVHAFGEHAVTVNGEGDVKSPADAQQAEELFNSKRFIVGNKVVTDAGKYVGQARNYEFDPETRKVTDLNISTRMFQKGMSVPVDEVMTIGRDVTIIKDNAVQAAQEQNQPT